MDYIPPVTLDYIDFGRTSADTSTNFFVHRKTVPLAAPKLFDNREMRSQSLTNNGATKTS